MKHVFEVDNVALTHACEHACAVFEAVGEDLLHLGQIHADGAFESVVEQDVGIVAIAFEVDDFGHVYAIELIARVEVKELRVAHGQWMNMSGFLMRI